MAGSSSHAFLFSLPPEFFSTLESTVAAGAAAAQPVAGAGGAAAAAAAAAADNADATATGWSEGMGATCIACGIGVTSQGFASSAEQRQHFKTDWHRYNVKRRVDRKPPLSEQAFEALLEHNADDVSSISGSDTDDSSEDDVSEDEHEAGGGLQDASLAAAAAAVGDSSRRPRRGKGAAAAVLQGPQVVFRAAGGDAYAVWRCLLLPDAHKHKQQQDASQLQLLQQLRQLRSSADAAAAAAAAGAGDGQVDSSAAAASGGCVWAVFMLRGGHFAAAVLRLNSSSGSGSSRGRGKAAAGGEQQGGSSGSQQPDWLQQAAAQGAGAEPFTVVASKTFHRYVVRAKAGGKQSTKDGTGKFARSAGSRLRRYNEVALSRDITSLLKEWGPWLTAAGLIFVAAPGDNSRVLFEAAAEAAGPGSRQGGSAASVLSPADPRVRRVPFVTQRPTFSEVKRVTWVLGGVRRVTLPSPEELAAAAAAAAAEGDKATAQQQQEAAAAAAAAATAAAAAAASTPVPAVKKPEDPPLLKAAKAGDAERVARLLANGHDPTARDARGRSAYQLAASKEVRDALRRHMAAAPTAWDWAAADVPSPLTDELEAAQASKKADKRARQKAKDAARRDKEGGDSSSSVGGAGGKVAAAGAAAAAGGGGDSFDDELAAAMAEAAAISSRAAAKSKQQVGGGGSSSRRGGGASSAAAAAARPSPEEAARRREQLAAAAEARLKAVQQKQQLW